MRNTFICEIDKQISSNQKLYDQTNFKIFKEQLQRLESLKSEVLMVMQDREQISNYLIKFLKVKQNFLDPSQ